jgi:hypothetical protein
MNRGPLRPPATLPVHDRYGHLTCLIAQVEYMFSLDGHMPDPWKIDRAISREAGVAPPSMAPATTYLLEHGYTIRARSPLNDEAFGAVSREEAREILWQWKGWPDQLRGEFLDEYPLDRIAELQAATRQWLARWKPFDFKWAEGTPTIDDVVQAIADGAVVRAVFHSEEILNEAMCLVSSVPRRRPQQALLVYGRTLSGEAEEFTPQSLDSFASYRWGIEAITRSG